MVQESFSGFCKRTATLPSDDSRISEQSFEHSRISFWNRGRSNQYRRFNYVTFAAGRMITAKGLSAGRHIFLETTYQVICVRAHMMREIRPSGIIGGPRETSVRVEMRSHLATERA